MILTVKISLEKLSKSQKNFDWDRPTECPVCSYHLWGHGYVLRYFNIYPGGLYIKRWRCSSCCLILTCRPEGYWRRYQESISNIYEALLYKVNNLIWPPWVSRQKAGHWIRKLILNAKINLIIKESLTTTICFYRDKNLAIF